MGPCKEASHEASKYSIQDIWEEAAVHNACFRRSCTMALAHPRKVGSSLKEAWPNTLDTHQLHYLKHDSRIFASVLLDPALIYYNASTLVTEVAYRAPLQNILG